MNKKIDKPTIVVCLIWFLIILVSIAYAADVKWTALTELTTPATTDLLCIVDDPAGTPISKKITRDNLVGNWAGSANITTLGTVATGTWQSTDVGVQYGGTGASTLTDGGILLGSGTGAITALGVATNGQIPIGDGTTDPVLATITGTANEVTVTNGVGTITLSLPNHAGTDITADLEEEVTEGSLADSTIVTADIKDGEIIEPDLDADVSAADGDFLQYDSTGTNFTWRSAAETLSDIGAQPLESTLTDIADGTIAENLVNTANPWADNEVADNITIDLATLATTLTITDNESTAENNALIFTSGGDLDGGNLGLECDGNAYYTPSTGTITATEFVGGGSGLTSIDAATGDSATAFFDAGTIEHEYGGLQADISGYTGLIAITGADTTAEIDAKSELEGQLADVTAIITDDDMPAASADPDIDAAGEIGRDTDGANETGDVSLRGHDGSNQFLYSRKLKTIQATIIKPNDLADSTRDACPIWSNETGMTFTITKIEAWSYTDDTTLNVEEEDANGANNATVDALEIATDGTGMYYTTETTITGATIEADHLILLDFDDTDDPGWVKISICGWFNADVD